MNKVRLTKILGLVSAVTAAAVLAIQGDYAQAGGILAASLSSANMS